MEPIKYTCGTVIKVGDNVQVRLRFGRKIRGKVIYVYNPDLASSRESNDYGVSIALENGKELWCGTPDSNIKLIRRD
ncbi:hypothetical protein NBRC116587_39520 [Pseudoteredinibacter isoporae]